MELVASPGGHFQQAGPQVAAAVEQMPNRFL